MLLLCFVVSTSIHPSFDVVCRLGRKQPSGKNFEKFLFSGNLFKVIFFLGGAFPGGWVIFFLYRLIHPTCEIDSITFARSTKVPKNIMCLRKRRIKRGLQHLQMRVESDYLVAFLWQKNCFLAFLRMCLQYSRSASGESKFWLAYQFLPSFFSALTANYFDLENKNSNWISGSSVGTFLLLIDNLLFHGNSCCVFIAFLG